jgi:hypothetical protein
VCARAAAECARCRLSLVVIQSTRRFLFLDNAYEAGLCEIWNDLKRLEYVVVVGPGGVVRVGVVVGHACSRGSQPLSNYGEGGGGVGDSRCKRRVCVSNREGDELHCSPVPLEGRDEGGVFLGLGGVCVFAAKVRTESDIDNDDCAKFLVEGGRVRGGGVRYPPLA